MQKALVGLAKFSLLLILLAAVGVFVANLLSVSSVEFILTNLTSNSIMAPDSNELLSFTINNTNTTFNVTEVNITLPGGFAFIQDSNITNVTAAFRNTTTVLTWTNTTDINYTQNGTFWFNVSVPNWAGNYSFNVTLVYNNSETNSTLFNVSITMPITPGNTLWGQGPQINLSNTTDTFFADGNWVPIIVNFTNEKGPLTNLTVTGNFSAIGTDANITAVNLGNGLYRLNATVNMSNMSALSDVIGGAMITITASNGSGVLNTQVGFPIVNMSIMDSCPRNSSQLPPFVPYNGSLLLPINCTPQNQNPCNLTTEPFYRYNSTHAVLCGPVWGNLSTNFTQLASTGNFENFSLVLDIPGKAMINISGVNFSSQQMAGAIMEFAMRNLMSGGRVGINESEWNGQNNRPNLTGSARLTLYNVSNMFGVQAPYIRFGNFSGFEAPNVTSVCTPTRCPYIAYSNGNITFDVASFSTYIVGNETYILNWTNVSGARERTVVTSQNASYLINISNHGNLTGPVIYNVSVVGNGTLNVTFVRLNSTEYSSVDTSTVVQLNVSNATNGTYTSYIIARYWNGTGQSSWNLSATDNITLTTTVQNASVTIALPANNSNVSLRSAVVFNITSNTNPNICNYSINGTANISLANCANTTLGPANFSEGRNNITVYLNDTYGNGGQNLTLTYITYFTADNSTPTVTIVTSNNINISGNYTINVSAGDAITGLRYVTLYLSNSTNEVNITNMTLSGNITDGNYSLVLYTANYADGSYNISINATDFVGITNATQRIDIKIDNSVPSATLNIPTNNSYLTGNITINITATDAVSGIDTVRFNLSNSSGQVNLTTLTNDGSDNFNITLYTANYAGGNYSLRAIVNNTAGLTNTTPAISIVLDNTAPTVSSWNYSFITKQLNIVFSERIDISTLDVTKFNITDNSGYVVLNGLSGATVATTTNSTTVVVNFTSAQDTIIRNLGSEGQMDTAAGAVKDLVAINVAASSNLGISAYLRYGVDIDLTGSIWNSFNLPLTVLQNRSSLSSNYTVEKVLESVWNNFAIFYYYNTTDWTSYRLGSGAGQTLANFTDNTGTNSYWIYMTTADRLQIA